MNTKTITGTITGGYTLSASYSALIVNGYGYIRGVDNSGNNFGGAGGTALFSGFGAYIDLAATYLFGGGGGAGVAVGASRYIPNVGGAGGAGGAGLILSSGGTAKVGGRVVVTVVGGAGGNGGVGGYSVLDHYGGAGGDGGAGGAGVVLSSGGTVINNYRIYGQTGGAGGSGGLARGSDPRTQGPGGDGGQGGDGVVLAAGGTLSNTHRIVGGAGGAARYQGFYWVYGSGAQFRPAYAGAGGSGVLVSSGGTVNNTGTISGGAAGYGGWGAASTGDGVVLTAGGALTNGSATVNSALISGQVGVYAGPTGAATVTNFGAIQGTGGIAVQFRSFADRLIAEAGSTWNGAVQGGGGTLELASGAGTITGLGATGAVSGAEAMTFSGFETYQLDAGTSWTLTGTNTLASQTLTVGGLLSNLGAMTGAGYGVVLAPGGSLINGSATANTAKIYGHSVGVFAVNGAATVTNFGTIGGGFFGVELPSGGSVTNGSATDTTALIANYSAAFFPDGVYAGPNGAATVTNFGTIQGTGGDSVLFKNAADRLIAEAGSTWIGAVQGGGGTLDLANGTGTVTGIGSTGVVSGAEAMTFSGFGSYEFAKGTWTLTGTNTLAAGATLTDKANLTNTGALTLVGAVGGSGTLTFAGGTAAIDAGAKISVATWSLTGGTTSLNESLTYKGAFSEAAGATLTVSTGDKLTLSGAATMSGLLNGAGTVVVANATLSGITVGGTTILSVTGTASQTGNITIGDATTAAGSLSIAKGATWTINGAFGIAEGTATTSSLTVAGTLIKSAAAGKSVIAVATTDTGLIEAARGTLDFASALTGTGALKIDSGAILEADGAVGKNLTASFNGGTATLALKAPSTFAATIAGFAVTDTIDLLKIAATGASINAKDQLVIVNGTTTVARLQLTGTYTAATFTIGSDGHGGTDVTLTAAAATRPPHAFIAAMAGLGAGAGSAVTAMARGEPWRTTLLAPRMRIA